MQSKKDSFIESIVNIVVGYLVACTSQIIIFPFFGIDIPLSDNFLIGLWFTAISLVRSYAFRRVFTKRTESSNGCDSYYANWRAVSVFSKYGDGDAHLCNKQMRVSPLARDIIYLRPSPYKDENDIQ